MNLCELEILLGVSAPSAGMAPGRPWALKSKFLRQQNKVSSPSLATERGSRTQERETSCSPQPDTSLRAVRNARPCLLNIWTHGYVDM